jgi:RNA polymerase sigma factor (sigma-70 family)
VSAIITPAMLQCALAGDRSQIRELIEMLTPTIQGRVARVLLKSQISQRGCVRQHVEDLTQEIFCRLFAKNGQALRSWDQTRGLNFASYVELLSEREAISILRNRKRSPYTERPTQAEELEQSLAVTESCDRYLLTRQMTLALCERLERTLTPLGFRVFTLLFCDDETPEAVSDQLNMTADAVYAWRSRIRKIARGLAEELSAEGPRRSEGGRS